MVRQRDTLLVQAADAAEGRQRRGLHVWNGGCVSVEGREEEMGVALGAWRERLYMTEVVHLEEAGAASLTS